jgi:hypothetical protein
MALDPKLTVDRPDLNETRPVLYEALNGIAQQLKEAEQAGTLDSQIWSDLATRWDGINASAKELQQQRDARVVELQEQVNETLLAHGAPQVPDYANQPVQKYSDILDVLDANANYVSVREIDQVLDRLGEIELDGRREQVAKLAQHEDVLVEALTRHRDDLHTRIEAAAETGTDSSKEQAALTQANSALETMSELGQVIAKVGQATEQNAEAAERATEAHAPELEQALAKEQAMEDKRQEALALLDSIKAKDDAIDELRASRDAEFEQAQKIRKEFEDSNAGKQPESHAAADATGGMGAEGGGGDGASVEVIEAQLDTDAHFVEIDQPNDEGLDSDVAVVIAEYDSADDAQAETSASTSTETP